MKTSLQRAVCALCLFIFTLASPKAADPKDDHDGETYHLMVDLIRVSSQTFTRTVVETPKAEKSEGGNNEPVTTTETVTEYFFSAVIKRDGPVADLETNCVYFMDYPVALPNLLKAKVFKVKDSGTKEQPTLIIKGYESGDTTKDPIYENEILLPAEEKEKPKKKEVKPLLRGQLSGITA